MLTSPTGSCPAARGRRDRLPGGVLPILLAGGRGSRLHELTDRLCKPAVPFIGRTRIVDFTVSNLHTSGFGEVLVATQYRAAPLERHLRAAWSDRLALKLRHAPTLTGRPEGSRGTADALRVLRRDIDAVAPRAVLVLAADHIYRMRYGPMIAAHMETGATLTVAADMVPRRMASAFGVLAADPGGRVSRFVEKPDHPPASAHDPDRSLASMGLYVIDWAWLRDYLDTNPAAMDFGHDVLPDAVAEGRSYVHVPGQSGPFYWRDVGTLDALRAAALDFLGPEPPFPLPRPHPPVLPRNGILDTLVMDGAVVSRGALLAGCVVAPGAVVTFGRAIGVDAARDRANFRRTAAGTTLVTAEMLAAADPARG